MIRVGLLAAAGALIAGAPASAKVLVFGPGGPAPAMREAAERFEQKTGIDVEVVSGPTPQWIDRAKAEADLIYSGSDTMMTDFVRALPGALNQSDVIPLYDRAAAILVRKGNPLRIRGFRDLVRRGVDVLVVEGAGQDGLWEDLASRAGGIGFLRQLRPHIKTFAANSAAARDAWTSHPEIDAWVIWNIWQIENPTIADHVPVEPDVVLYRSMAIAPTRTSRSPADARAFANYLHGPEAAEIFRRHGWRAPAGDGGDRLWTRHPAGDDRCRVQGQVQGRQSQPGIDRRTQTGRRAGSCLQPGA